MYLKVEKGLDGVMLYGVTWKMEGINEQLRVSIPRFFFLNNWHLNPDHEHANAW